MAVGQTRGDHCGSPKSRHSRSRHSDSDIPDLEIPDHRRLGRQLRIFATDEACGTGLPLWLPAGAVVRAEIERFIVDLERLYGYLHVYTPEMAKRHLYERSGHWAHYHDDMYPPMELDRAGCPAPHELSTSHPRVRLRTAHHPRDALPVGRARDHVPVRAVRCGRRAFPGAANDPERWPRFLRPRARSARDRLDPGTCRPGLRGAGSARPQTTPIPERRRPKYAADVSAWERSEELVRSVLADLGLDYTEAKGEAAFYGPRSICRWSTLRAGREPCRPSSSISTCPNASN